jgi:hypothetical protein
MTEDNRRKLVIIEDSTLASMAANDSFVKEFPFLQALRVAPKRTGCGSCARNSTAGLFGSAKKAVAGLDSEKKRKLKELLNTKELRVTYRTGDGRIVTLVL